MSSDDLVAAAQGVIAEWDGGKYGGNAVLEGRLASLRAALAAKPEPGLDALTQAVTDALAVIDYVLIDETSGLPGTEPAFARALASRLTPDTGANR